jgi:hypothetical protein
VVALARCRSYGAESELALRESFARLGGLGSLVRGKTVTVKVNLTGRPFEWLFGKPPGETYLTHGDTALALARVLFDEGALRLRFVESVPFREPMAVVLDQAGWDVRALLALGRVGLENTRNLDWLPRWTPLPIPGSRVPVTRRETGFRDRWSGISGPPDHRRPERGAARGPGDRGWHHGDARR